VLEIKNPDSQPASNFNDPESLLSNLIDDEIRDLIGCLRDKGNIKSFIND